MSRITFAGFSKDTSTLPDGLFYKCLVWNVGDKIIGPYFFLERLNNLGPVVKGVFLNLASKLALESRLRTHHWCKNLRFKQLIRDLLSVWCFHNRLFNAYFDAKFKKIPVIKLS
jgi:hypothetical protein